MLHIEFMTCYEVQVVLNEKKALKDDEGKYYQVIHIEKCKEIKIFIKKIDWKGVLNL